MNLREELFSNQDLEYKAFHSKLVPTVNPDKIIGVRIPILRKNAKTIPHPLLDVHGRNDRKRLI